MFQRRSIASLAVVILLQSVLLNSGLVSSPLLAAPKENSAPKEKSVPNEDSDGSSLWVTGISQVGSTSQFAVATANGLLLRESAVMSFDSSDPTKLTEIYKHPAAAWCVDATSDGKTIASVDYRGNLVTFDVASKKPTTHEKAMERWCQAMLIAPDDKHIVAGNEAGKLMVWDIAAAKVSKSAEVDSHAITGLAFSNDAMQLAASDGAGHIHLLKWPSLDEIGKIEVGKESLWCVAFTPDDKHLLCGSSDRNLYRCEAKPDAKATSLAKGKDWITRIAISDGGQVAASEVSGRLHFQSPGLSSVDGSASMEAKSGVWALCWNGDGQLIAGTRKHGLVTAGQSWKWTETKPAEPKPAETKPAETKPAEPKPAETKPAETKPAKPKAPATPKKEPAEEPAKKPAAPIEPKPAVEVKTEAKNEVKKDSAK